MLHVLGRHDLDLALLRARFRSLSAFDIVFETIGSEPTLEHEPAMDSAAAGSGRCGDCDCSDGEHADQGPAPPPRPGRPPGPGRPAAAGLLPVQHFVSFRVLQLRGLAMAGREAEWYGLMAPLPFHFSLLWAAPASWSRAALIRALVGLNTASAWYHSLNRAFALKA